MREIELDLMNQNQLLEVERVEDLQRCDRFRGVAVCG